MKLTGSIQESGHPVEIRREILSADVNEGLTNHTKSTLRLWSVGGTSLSAASSAKETAIDQADEAPTTQSSDGLHLIQKATLPASRGWTIALLHAAETHERYLMGI